MANVVEVVIVVIIAHVVNNVNVVNVAIVVNVVQRLSTLELLRFRVRKRISSKVSIFSSRFRLEPFFFFFLRSVPGIGISVWVISVTTGLKKKFTVFCSASLLPACTGRV